jgi:hypothetical protein
MQIFLPYKDVFETAKCLDPKRLSKQIIECGQILDAIDGTGKGWFNHPIVKMYEDHYVWVLKYKEVLELFRKRVYDVAAIISAEALGITPYFITDDYCDQMKRRLYTKDPEHYAQFAGYGMSYVNWYFVDGEWVKYKNGKRV